MRVQKGLA